MGTKTKTFRLLSFLLGIVLLIGLAIIGCKKDDESDSSLSTTEVAEVQDAESQDAVADQVEDDVDNVIEQIVSNDFSGLKSSYDCVTVSIDKTDTVNFPKTITLTYACSDTVNGEHITQTGTLSITVELVGTVTKPWRNHIKRTIRFTDFTVTTDSSSITINGTRTMQRQSGTIGLSDNEKQLRVAVKDTINADLTFTISYDGVNKDITRKVAKSRTCVLYYARLTTLGKWFANFSKDTVTFEGSVTGTNAKGDTYSRVITTPLVFSFCPVWPYNPILTGEMTFTVGSETPYTITYAADGCKTSATISRNGNTKTFTRKWNLKFRKWW